jgi:hypothetical protein
MSLATKKEDFTKFMDGAEEKVDHKLHFRFRTRRAQDTLGVS